jgi:hypothetical protein
MGMGLAVGGGLLGGLLIGGEYLQNDHTLIIKTKYLNGALKLCDRTHHVMINESNFEKHASYSLRNSCFSGSLFFCIFFLCLYLLFFLNYYLMIFT